MKLTSHIQLHPGAHNRPTQHLPDVDHLESASNTLARRALFITLSLGLAGAVVGTIAIQRGLAVGAEAVLILCSVSFFSGALGTLLVFRKVALQAVATVSTSCSAIILGAGMLITVYGKGEYLNLFVYLSWFFPLLVFNELVNRPAVGRLLARILLFGPELIIVCLSPQLMLLLTAAQQILLASYCISYLSFGVALNIVTRHREKYIVEREQTESLKVEAAILESISDCFISLDSRSRLVYLNDAACKEFAVERQTVLNKTLSFAAPHFFSQSMMTELYAASAKSVATIFEAQNEERQLWYDLRCFPRPDGMSIYFRDITSRKADEARIHYLAFYDVLTELPNRQLLRDRLSTALATAARRGSAGALLYIDLDDFKTLNDTTGHDTGDALLKQVALRLASCIGPGDTVARLGGDEFVVMLEGLSENAQTAAASARVVGEKVLGIFRSPFIVDTYERETTASIGVTLFFGASATADDLLKQTDLALYRAKAQGRNAMYFFDPTMQIGVDTRAALRSDLRRALENGELQLHYQPQVDVDGVITGAEALMRWQHPLRGAVSPVEFIPLAEEAGLIIGLGSWALETACVQLAKWQTRPEMREMIVAVNVSSRQFLDPQFVNLVLKALRTSRADPRGLKLEITESCVMEKVDETIVKMTDLKGHGVGFSLDDFGTGYSSLSHLGRLPLDQLKIDRTFVSNMLTDDKDASIARTIILLGRDLNLSVIAEGVETQAQRDFLKTEGCHLYQGFLYSPAVAVSELEAFVALSASVDRPKYSPAVLPALVSS
jgi:diguanylate cyclase (GGDEF)-like protein